MRIYLCHNHKCSRRGSGGLIEVILTVAIVSLATISIFMLLKSSQREMILSKEFMTASTEANKIVETLNGVPYESLLSTDGMVNLISYPFFNKSSAGSELENLTELIRVSEHGGVKTINIEVQWKTKGKEANAEASKIEFVLFRTPF